MNSNWRTKADLVKDFGLPGSDPDIDDRYILRGDCRPPPLLDYDEDFEISERYRSAISHDSPRAPDLGGITKILREVDAYNDYCEPKRPVGNLLNNDIIIISKLNPNSQEFVPKIAQKKVSETEEKTVSEVKHTDEELQNKDSILKKEVQELRPPTKEDLPLTVSKLKKNDLELQALSRKESQTKVLELKKDVSEPRVQSKEESNKNVLEIKKKDQELRAQISEASKDNSNNGKRAKNVAIRSLMKLYSSSPVKIDEVKPVVLLKPEHFEKPVSKFVETPLINESVGNCELSTKIAPELNEVESQAIQESCDKVNNWLEQSMNPQKSPPSKFDAHQQQVNSSTSLNRTGSPAISCGSLTDNNYKPLPMSYLTTCSMFRKKESSSTVTSPRQTAANSPTKVLKSNEYVPSQFANEMFEKFKAKQKAKESKELLFGPHVYVGKSKRKTKEGRKEKKEKEDSE